jgi:hypothetical protein
MGPPVGSKPFPNEGTKTKNTKKENGYENLAGPGQEKVRRRVNGKITTPSIE